MGPALAEAGPAVFTGPSAARSGRCAGADGEGVHRLVRNKVHNVDLMPSCPKSGCSLGVFAQQGITCDVCCVFSAWRGLPLLA